MRPNDKLKAWRAEKALQRIGNCRFMLYAHGFLSESENEKVKHRIRKWCEQEPKKEKP